MLAYMPVTEERLQVPAPSIKDMRDIEQLKQMFSKEVIKERSEFISRNYRSVSTDDLKKYILERIDSLEGEINAYKGLNGEIYKLGLEATKSKVGFILQDLFCLMAHERGVKSVKVVENDDFDTAFKVVKDFMNGSPSGAGKRNRRKK
jgi:hypothetical protein